MALDRAKLASLVAEDIEEDLGHDWLDDQTCYGMTLKVFEKLKKRGYAVVSSKELADGIKTLVDEAGWEGGG